MKKFYNIILLFVIAICATACGKGDDAASSNLSMADEMAGGLSGNTVPVEATYYSSVSFNVPEGMTPDKDNTDLKAFYLAVSSNDYSFISYQKRDNAGNITCDTMSLDNYKDAFVDQLGVAPYIQNFVREKKADYSKIVIDLTYSVSGISYSCREYIFITGKCIFTITLCQDTRYDWSEQFKMVEEGFILDSVIGSVADKDVPVDSIVEDVKNGQIIEKTDNNKEINVDQ